MNTPRIIPVLLLKGAGLVKGQKFKNHKYVGDPINAVNIFNTKEVDELVFLDIDASNAGRTIQPQLVETIADECFMPFAVGGGITNISQVKDLLAAGAEKVVIGTAALHDKGRLVSEIASRFGSQSVVVSVDVKLDFFKRRRIYGNSGTREVNFDLIDYVQSLQKAGVGEIILNSINHEGMMAGYNIALIKEVSNALTIPVIAGSGAGTLEDLRDAFCEGGASALAAGSLFVFYGRKRAVLINYPTRERITQIFEV